MEPRPDPEFSLREAFEQCPGQWIAVDRRTGSVVLAAPSPYVLAAEIKKRGLTHVAVVRAPERDQAELVGLG